MFTHEPCPFVKFYDNIQVNEYAMYVVYYFLI